MLVLVKEGDFIGLTGNSGNAAGLTNKGQDHVHIESAVGGVSPSRANNDARINPEQFMQTKFDDNGSAIVDPPDAVDLTELF